MRRHPFTRLLTTRRLWVPVLGITLIGTGALLASSAAAGSTTRTTTENVVEPGWKLTISGHGCVPGAVGAPVVDAWIDHDKRRGASAEPHPDGTWQVGVVVPPDIRAGEHELFAQCHYPDGSTFSFDHTPFSVRLKPASTTSTRPAFAQTPAPAATVSPAIPSTPQPEASAAVGLATPDAGPLTTTAPSPDADTDFSPPAGNTASAVAGDTTAPQLDVVIPSLGVQAQSSRQPTAVVPGSDSTASDLMPPGNPAQDDPDNSPGN